MHVYILLTLVLANEKWEVRSCMCMRYLQVHVPPARLAVQPCISILIPPPPLTAETTLHHWCTQTTESVHYQKSFSDEQRIVTHIC